MDANQPDVVKALRKIGAEVTHMHQLGGGVSDLLVSFRQRWYVLEVKDDDGELNELQRIWIGNQKAPVYTIRSAEQAVEFLTRETPDWLLGLTAQTMSREHICEGPKGDDEPMADPIRKVKETIVERVYDALLVAWRSHIKLTNSDLCLRLRVSKESKRVEKALRHLIQQGLVLRDGNNRTASYWAEETK